MFCYMYNEEKIFICKIECELDPLETKKQGKEIYLLPADCTFKEPPEKKEGFIIKWDGDNWFYEEIPEQPKPHEPTEEEKKESVRSLRNYYLQYWDFSQLDDAPFTEEEKEKLRQYRQYLRDYTEKPNWWLENPFTYEEWGKIYETLANGDNSGG